MKDKIGIRDKNDIYNTAADLFVQYRQLYLKKSKNAMILVHFHLLWID
jgi:hypothetical protein